MTLNNLERQFDVSVMRIVTKWLRLELHGFRFEVALYLTFPPIKFYDKIQRESLLISSIISD